MKINMKMQIWSQLEWGVILVFTAVMMAFFMYLLVNSKHSRMRFYYCMMHMTAVLIAVVNFACGNAPTAELRVTLFLVIGILMIGFNSLFVFYSLIWQKRVNRIIILILFVLYAVSGLILILGNPLHHGYVEVMANDNVRFGILYYIYLCISMVIESAGILFLAKYWLDKLENRAYRAGATVVAILAIILTHLSLLQIHTEPVNLYPLALLVCFTFFFIGAGRYSMFDAVSYTSKYGLELFTDAVLMMNEKEQVLYWNKTCEQLGENVLHLILERVRVEQNSNKNALQERVTEIDLMEEDIVNFYTVTVKPVRRRAFYPQTFIIIIHDDTKNVTAINTLTEKNQYLKEMYDSMKSLSRDTQKLAVLTERNTLAQEIHDVVGHSLILVLNTLESNKMLPGDRAIAMRRIRRAVAEIDSSIIEIGSEQGVSGSGRFEMLISRLSWSGVKLEINGCEVLDLLPEYTVSSIFRICQESITNAIKHGNATSITISFKHKENQVELFLIDNGTGCSQIVKGTGLTGMEERARRLRGSVGFSSFEERGGFMVRMTIPI